MAQSKFSDHRREEPEASSRLYIRDCDEEPEASSRLYIRDCDEEPEASSRLYMRGQGEASSGREGKHVFEKMGACLLLAPHVEPRACLRFLPSASQMVEAKNIFPQKCSMSIWTRALIRLDRGPNHCMRTSQQYTK
jgi:hypothetical protein